MSKLTCTICVLTLLFLCTFTLCTELGEKVEIYNNSVLKFKWNYWGWKQDFEFHFAIDGASDTKLMNARVNYTEGCFDNTLCSEITLISVALEMENIRKDLFNVNESNISVFYDIGEMVNVDKKSLELRATNLEGDVLINSDKISGETEFNGTLETSKFLNRNINTVLFTLIGNRLPSRFNFTFGQTVNVTYDQENHLESDRKDLDLIIKREEFEYRIYDNYKLTLQDYYWRMCIRNQMYGLIDVIRYYTNKRKILGSMALTYEFKGNSDYFGNSLKRLNMSQMQMVQFKELVGQNIDSRKIFVPQFERFSQDQEIYIMAPIDHQYLTHIDAATGSFTKGKVSKGDFKVFNVKFTAKSFTKLNYQVTSPSSTAIFLVTNVFFENDICPDYSRGHKFIQANYSTSLDDTIILNRGDGPTYFSVIVGCISDTDCEFLFNIAVNDDLLEINLIAIIVPNAILVLIVMFAVVLVSVIIYNRRKRRMRDRDSVTTPLVIQ